MRIELDLYQTRSGADFYIKNYSELDDNALQEIIEFAESRNGYYREDLKRFSIRKRAERSYLEKIFQLSGLDVSIREPKSFLSSDEQTFYGVKKLHVPNVISEVVTFGKHKGELWGDLPEAYLRWIQGSMKGDNVEMAKKVLLYRQALKRQVNS